VIISGCVRVCGEWMGEQCESQGEPEGVRQERVCETGVRTSLGERLERGRTRVLESASLKDPVRPEWEA